MHPGNGAGTGVCVITQIYRLILIDGRVVFFNSEKAALDSVRLTYSAMAGHVSQILRPKWTGVYFNHALREPELVGTLSRVYGGELIYTAAEHL